MKYFIFSLFFFLLISCVEQESDIRFTQFTSDDLSYLYFNSDTLVFTGSTINYVDTITFMLNGSEIISVPVETEISATPNIFFPDLEAGIQGESTLQPKNGTGFRYADIIISRNFIDDKGSKKLFTVGVNELISYSKEFFMNDPIPLDTALVLGVHYENVIKFKPDSLSQTNIKSIYFAKKFGFIKIETLDGKIMERVLPGKLGLGY